MALRDAERNPGVLKLGSDMEVQFEPGEFFFSDPRATPGKGGEFGESFKLTSTLRDLDGILSTENRLQNS